MTTTAAIRSGIRELYLIAIPAPCSNSHEWEAEEARKAVDRRANHDSSLQNYIELKVEILRDGPRLNVNYLAEAQTPGIFWRHFHDNENQQHE